MIISISLCSMLGLCPSWVGTDSSCRSCHNHCEFKWATVLLSPEDSFLEVTRYLRISYILYVSSFIMVPESREDGCEINATFRGEHSAISFSLNLDELYVFMLTSACCIKKLLWCRMIDALIYEYNNHSLGVCLTACLFSRRFWLISTRDYGVSTHRFLALVMVSDMRFILWGRL